ncbi:glycosyltransferase [Halobacterium zhouii]|uniref:glycosyltransferase n=1 Tax=Halobacterium zhouii TaxID=2902624 RepID=UPI001E30B3D2|nr:glycosyltransferase [Halobacterium zhouii]
MTHWDHVPELHDYDVIVQSGNNPGWYIPREEQTIVKYVHTPPRNPYDRHPEFADSMKHTVFAHIVRTLYAQTHSYPDVYVANSELVARRCEQYFGIPQAEIEVVYPPTDVDSYGAGHASNAENVEPGEFYFTFSRLYPGKNIDTIVEAFNQLGDEYQLVVGGSGPERERLEKLAGDNVRFFGYVSEEQKRALCAASKAGIFAAQNEDFGMVPVEFFASGTPVLGVEDGYTKYQIADGGNGYTFERNPTALAETIRQYEEDEVDWSNERIESFAEQFSTERFREKMHQVVDNTEKESRITPKWQQEAITNE